MTQTLSLEGQIDKIIFQNPENGYTVFKLRLESSDKYTCVGTSPNIKIGQLVKVSGTLEENKYGQQLVCDVLTPILPKDEIGIIRYLSSGIIPGIGEGFAKKLVKFAGVNLFKILDENPKSLYEIEGIGKKRLDVLVKNWKDYRNAHEVMMFLQRFAVGPKRAMKIYQTYQENTLNILQTNPYQIYQDIAGIGFKIADQIAQATGIDNQAEVRIQAGLQYILEQGMQSGHCFLPTDKIHEQVCKILNLSSIPSLQNAFLQDCFHLTDNGNLYLKNVYLAEKSIKERLTSINCSQSIWTHKTTEQYLEWMDEIKGIQLSTSQRQAIFKILDSKIGVITGGPGVGKTTVTNTILQIARKAKLQTLLCAPTGRAAKKLAACTNSSAKTIHRLLKMDPVERKFQHNKNNPLKADLIIIDEASMIDVFLAQHLFNAIDPLTNIIIIGDIDQLPSVGPGAILKDIISILPSQTAHLTEIFRQAKDSHIIQNAHLVNKGKMLIPNEQDRLSDFYFIAESNPEQVLEKINKLIVDRIPNRFQLNPLHDVQVLCPMHKGSLGTENLNKLLQSTLNNKAKPSGIKFKIGDKVIQTKNNYDKDVFNGDVGYVKSICKENSEITVDFSDLIVNYLFSELDELQLAYAISIHKSQGSEYPAIIIPLAMQHFTLLERNLLYTAITRGKKLVILIGEMKAVAMAIRNQSSKKRYTNLGSLQLENEEYF